MSQQAFSQVKYTEISDSAIMALMPVVSVHMITYNHGLYLAKAIEGVIAQKSDFPIELIIGEDCSTDNTRQIALDYQRRYPQLIRVIYSNENIGMMKNVRRVLNACRGQYVALCEGDDYWIDPEKLSEQVATLSRLKNIDITFHSCYLKYEKQGKEVLSSVCSPVDRIFTLPEIIIGRGDFMPTASILARRSTLMSIQNWFKITKPPIGDYFMQVFGSRNGGAYYINKPMSVYRTEVDVSWSETTKPIDTLLKFESNFFLALKEFEQVIPGQEEAFKHHIVSHYSGRFTDVNNENFSKMKAFILSVLKDIYDSEIIVEHNDGAEPLEWAFFLKFANDSGKVKELKEYENRALWQFFRVARSLLGYGILTLKMLNIKQSGSSECEKTMAKWKTEVQRSYLIARWKRLCKLIAANIR
ncbi:glycosyltransferase family 2 protein [Methylobacter psychrophilus]|uniref:glycosyltransferase family 2 protein n=1 Tax=Methylobacter psychrophilus TaxID=96941 RepID=UPI0021D4FE9A|nr:glycosyltransferase [Methylobacter psychrophilus]